MITDYNGPVNLLIWKFILTAVMQNVIMFNKQSVILRNVTRLSRRMLRKSEECFHILINICEKKKLK